MAEWLKAHAWKACIPQGIQGSNPCLSATHFKHFPFNRSDPNSQQTEALPSGSALSCLNQPDLTLPQNMPLVVTDLVRVKSSEDLAEGAISYA